MKTLDSFENDSLFCAASYLFNPNLETRFDSLVECAIEASGMTQQCATLWAHLGAATASECAGACPTDLTTGLSTLNGPAPACPLSECLSCPAVFNGDFAILQGRSLEGSGMTERTARPCSVFTRIVHDPCARAEATLSPVPTSSPTEAPPTMTSDARTCLQSMAALTVYGMVAAATMTVVYA